MTGVLQGIRVLDFGRYIAGPYCAALLAEQGAEVIRIEKRGGAARIAARRRSLKAARARLFMQMNRNKLGLTLDPMKPEGREIVRRLVATADVVIANLPPQTLQAMELDYDSLKAVKPDIILTTATAYGRGGPYSDRVGFDGIGQVMCGAAYLTGDDEDSPVRFQASWVDFGTALHCAFGTMTALMHRKATGRGQWVEGALLGTALTVTNSVLIEQAVIKADRKPSRSRSQTSGPDDILRCKDGQILAACVGNPLFKRVALMIGRAGSARGPALQDRHRSRRQRQGPHGHHGAVDTRAHLRGGAGGVRRGEGSGSAGADAASRARRSTHQRHGLLPAGRSSGHGDAGAGRQGAVWLSETPGTIRHRAPTIGEHTDQVMSSLGYTQDEIEGLKGRGVI